MVIFALGYGEGAILKVWSEVSGAPYPLFMTVSEAQ